MSNRTGPCSPYAIAMVLETAATRIHNSGHEIDAWPASGPACVESAVLMAATGHPFGRAPGFDGERARELGMAAMVEADLVAEYSDVWSWETVDRPSADEVVAFLRHVAQHVCEVAAEERAARRERAAARRERLAVAA
jgi:hypothetical protein